MYSGRHALTAKLQEVYFNVLAIFTKLNNLTFV